MSQCNFAEYKMAQSLISEEGVFLKVLVREPAICKQHSGTIPASKMWTDTLCQVRMRGKKDILQEHRHDVL